MIFSNSRIYISNTSKYFTQSDCPLVQDLRGIHQQLVGHPKWYHIITWDFKKHEFSKTAQKLCTFSIWKKASKEMKSEAKFEKYTIYSIDKSWYPKYKAFVN